MPWNVNCHCCHPLLNLSERVHLTTTKLNYSDILNQSYTNRITYIRKCHIFYCPATYLTNLSLYIFFIFFNYIIDFAYINALSVEVSEGFFFFLNCYMLQIISTLRVWTKWFSSSLDDQDHELKVYSELEQCIDSLQWKCVGGVIGIFHSGALKSLCAKLFFFFFFFFSWKQYELGSAV